MDKDLFSSLLLHNSIYVDCIATLTVGLLFGLQVYKAMDSAMVLNITTNKPTFYIRGLSAGTEYFVEIYAANSKGRSERTLFETFTLQV